MLQTAPVQSFIRDKAESYLRKKTGADVHIGKLYLSWFSEARLERVYIGDLQHQALFYSGKLSLRYDLLALARNKLVVYDLHWEDLLLNAYSLPDGKMNYQFLADAFSSPPDTTAAKSETGEAMQIDIRQITVEKLRLRYHDETSGMYAVLQLPGLHTKIQTIDPGASLYDVRELRLNGLGGVFRQDFRPALKTPAATPSAPSEENNPLALLVKAKLLELNNSHFIYADEGSGISTGWSLEQLSLKLASIDMAKTQVNGGYINLEKPRGFVQMAPAKDSSEPAPATAPNTWTIRSPGFAIQGGVFRMDNTAAARAAPNTFDAGHIYLSPLELSLKQVIYTPAGLTAELEKLQVQERSGFGIKQAHASIVYSDSLVSLKNLLFETNQSRIAKEISISGPGWDKLANNLPAMGIHADLDNTHLVLAEALYFVPQYRNDPNFKKIWDKVLDLDGRIGGSLANLAVEQLHLADNVGNDIKLTGKLQSVTDSKKVYAALSDLKINSGKKAIEAWLPENTLPANIQLPAQLQVAGSLSGGMESVSTNMRIRSSYGLADFSGDIRHYTDSINSSYDLQLRQLDMDLGKWISDTSIGRLVANGHIKGKGYALSKMQASGEVVVEQARYNGYEYRNIGVAGKLDKGNYEAEVQSTDPNLQVSVQLSGALSDGMPTASGDMKIDRVDLQALGLTTSPLVLKGLFQVNLVNTKPHQLEGDVFITGLQFADAKNIYALDSISILAHAAGDTQLIQLKSPFGQASATGNYDYTSIFTLAQQIVQHHLQAPGKDSLLAKTPAPQTMDLQASLRWPGNLHNLAPGLHMNQPLLVTARVVTDSLLVKANVFLPVFSYDSLRVDSTHLRLLANRDSLQVDAGLSSLAHPTVPLYRTALRAKAVTGELDWHLRLDDKAGAEKYRLGGDLSILPDSGYDIRLSEELLLNKTVFTTGEKNLIQLSPKGIRYAALQLLAGDQSLQLETKPATGTALPPVDLSLKDFRLSTLTGIVGKDSALAEAKINGELHVTGLDATPLVSAGLHLNDITVTSIPVGDLAVQLETPVAGQYDITAALTGQENDVQVKGRYAENMAFEVLLNKLNLHSLEPFAMGQASRMKGYANGKIAIAGSADKPQVRGELGFNDAQANITMINTTLQLSGNKMVFDEKGILFNEFILKDSLGGTTTVNGRINTTDYSNYAFDLRINTDNFMVLGPKASHDQAYYGPAFIDSRINVGGDLDLPVIDMNVTLRDKSKVTITLPDDAPGIEDREGVIRFVNRSNPADSSLLAARGDSLVAENEKIRGMDFSAAINITKTSTINIIIDPVNGDYLEAMGTASLNLTIDPSGKMSMTGKYALEDGKYEMSLNQLIKRSFAIVKGSSITWDGDPTGAELDITARHDVKAPAIDLIGDQLTSATTNKKQYNQRIPVEVYLMITEKLMKPTIKFRLDMPEKDRAVFNGAPYTRIKQINNIESQLNKQVMGLLVLQSFISEDPMASLESGAGGSMEDAARQSVSKVLSQQLNNLAGNLIKGVDLNFDLQSEEDYSTGSKTERTSLNIGASKSLFNDRLTVAVGSNIGIAGNTPGNASALIGDITVDYALSRDGRYKLRAFQRNQTDAILQGQIIETGLTFMLVMDFNTFSEILRRSKEDIELKKREQEAKQKK